MSDLAYHRETDAASAPQQTAHPQVTRWPPSLSILLAILASLGLWALLYYGLRVIFRAL